MIAVIEGDGFPRRFVPGEGLVDWPAVIMWTHNGEPGADRITEEEAVRLLRAGVGGPVDWGIVARARGDAPTIQPPM
ncbi:hypothetical protein [Geodermatophilus sp. SYSU D00766]